MRSTVAAITSGGVSRQRTDVQRGAGVVDDAGQPAVLGGGREEPVDAVGVGEVGAHGDAAGAGVLDREPGLLGGRVVARVAEHQVVAVAGEPERGRGADAAGAAGDQRDAHGSSSKSAKSKPGETTQLTSASTSDGTVRCQTPAGTSACGWSASTTALDSSDGFAPVPPTSSVTAPWWASHSSSEATLCHADDSPAGQQEVDERRGRADPAVGQRDVVGHPGLAVPPTLGVRLEVERLGERRLREVESLSPRGPGWHGGGMLRDLPPFRADRVGSLLRPKSLLKAREDHAAGAISAAQLHELEDATIIEVIDLRPRPGFGRRP